MRWTVTAVPGTSAMPFRRRYSRARSLHHERCTASTAAINCSMGARGKRRPASSAWISRNSPAMARSPRWSRSGRPNTHSCRRILATAWSKGRESQPSTISANWRMRRRYESQVRRGLPVRRSNPERVSSFRPTLSSVSIIPGIDCGAPERTATSSGRRSAPNARPVASSRPRTAAARWSISANVSGPRAASPGEHQLVGSTKPCGTLSPSAAMRER